SRRRRIAGRGPRFGGVVTFAKLVELVTFGMVELVAVAGLVDVLVHPRYLRERNLRSPPAFRPRGCTTVTHAPYGRRLRSGLAHDGSARQVSPPCNRQGLTTAVCSFSHISQGNCVAASGRRYSSRSASPSASASCSR